MVKDGEDWRGLQLKSLACCSRTFLIALVHVTNEKMMNSWRCIIFFFHFLWGHWEMIFPASSLRSWRDLLSCCFVSALEPWTQMANPRGNSCEQSCAKPGELRSVYPTANLFDHQIQLNEGKEIKIFAFAFLILSLFLCLLELCSAQSQNYES